MKNLSEPIDKMDINKKLIDIATYNQKAIQESIINSNTALTFVNTLKKLSTCPEFYTLIFSIQDSEITIEIRKELGLKLQEALYGNKLSEFKDIVNHYLSNAQDDYETSYFLIILESINDFIKTAKYLEYYAAKTELDNDHSAASEQLKAAIRNMKEQLNQMIYQTQFDM